MAAEPNYYTVLGVAPDSEDVVIQAAYRALMRRYHPDKNPSEAARKRTVEINAAYAILGDPSKRASYDATLRKSDHSSKASRNNGESSPPPPPPPPPPKGNKATPPDASDDGGDAKGGQPSGAAMFFGIVGTLVAISIGLAAVGTNSAASNNTMNVDENLTTVDMETTAADLNETANMAAADAALNEAAAAAENEQGAEENLSGAFATPTSLSSQQQSSVSYDTIESAADRFASILVSRGILGARAFSESCHKDVQARPTWDAADKCAAFDYAAAYVDEAVSRSNSTAASGYFQFQRANQDDSYAAVGAPSWATMTRLSKIRQAAESAAADAVRAEIWRHETIARMRGQQSPGKPATQQSSPATNMSD